MGGQYSRTILLVVGIVALVIVLKISAVFQGKPSSVAQQTTQAS